jgi:gamma-glutamyl-gamma-aminobutyrate hydrolase PuuD
MIPLVLTTQRTVGDALERRDALDQRWAVYLAACGLAAVPVLNHLPTARALADSLHWSGLLLTGGNSLVECDGDAPERDEVERHLLACALARGAPILGVCRGMQLLLVETGVRLRRVDGHVAASQWNTVDGRRRLVNSYHEWGTPDVPSPWQVWARADDGVVKGIRDPRRRIVGIMWHPERLEPLPREDIELFRCHLAANDGDA